MPFYLCRLLRIEIANPFAWTAGEKSLSRNFNLQTLPCSRKGDGTSQSSLRVIWYSAISTVVQGVAAGEKDARERGNNRHTHQRLGYTKYQMERQIAQLQKRISVLKWEMPRAGPEQPVSHAEGSPFLLT